MAISPSAPVHPGRSAERRRMDSAKIRALAGFSAVCGRRHARCFACCDAFDYGEIAMRRGLSPRQTCATSWRTNDHQLVSAADAEQLAAALERALPEIPNADILLPHRTEDSGGAAAA